MPEERSLPLAQLTVTVPDALVPRVMAAIRASQPEAVGLTDAQAARQFLASHIRQTVTRYEERLALETAVGAGNAARQQAWADTTDIG